MNRIQNYQNQLASLKKGSKVNILLIGSGLMAETLVEHLIGREENNFTIASFLLQEASELALKFPRCKAVYLDVMKQNDELTQLVKSSQIVVAYVPPQFIMQIAKVCLQQSRHLVTSQYIKPEMQAMHAEAQRKNILFLNEIGLDPGLDHLATYSVQQKVKEEGGKLIIEYESWCGGLPAPEYTNNPLGYKFSWSPLAAIKNINNDSRYIENNVEKYIPGSHNLYSRQLIKINPALVLEGFPNRDSVSYKELYGLSDCTKVLRGTLRYVGFSIIMSGFSTLGLISDDPIPKHLSEKTSFYTYLNQVLLKVPSGPQKVSSQYLSVLAKEAHTNKTHTQIDVEVLLARVFNKIMSHDYYSNKSKSEIEEDARLIFEAMDWLRMFDESLKIKINCSHVENFGELLQSRLGFLPGETDLVVMQHIFKIVYPNDERIHTKKSTLILTGDRNGKTAMAKTVSIPTAIAIQLILDDKILVRGVHLPNVKEINEPISQELIKYGLMCLEEEG